MRDVVAGEPLFMRKPEPQFFVSGLEDSAVNVTFRALTRTQDYFNLRWKYTAEIKKRFVEEKITIPFPQRVVHFVDRPQGPV
jgi:small conductance mechanosensitive channel